MQLHSFSPEQTVLYGSPHTTHGLPQRSHSCSGRCLFFQIKQINHGLIPALPAHFPRGAAVRCKPPDAAVNQKSGTNSLRTTAHNGYWRVCRPASPEWGMKWTARCSRHHSRCGRRSAPPDARVRPFFLRQIQTRLVRGNFLIRGIYHPQTALRAGNALNSLNVLFAAVLIIRRKRQ